MSCSTPSWERLVTERPSQAVPTQTHHFIRNQLLGTSLANSATLSALPLRNPFTSSPKRDRGKKFHLLQLRARKLHNCVGTQAAYQIFCFRKHLGSVHSPFIVVPSSQVTVFHLLWDTERGFLSEFWLNDAREVFGTTNPSWKICVLS